ncbi:MAG: pitrilysin family protein [Caldilineaceae bacterium]|nr:pitrilysin family protein [Caldilineaceae bacterium]
MNSHCSISPRIHAPSARAAEAGQTMIGPETVHRVQTPNGITILVRPNPSAPVVMLEGALRAGSVDEPANLTGLASFTASLVSRGSASYDFDRFNEAVESVGASVSAGGGTHVTNFGSESLVEDFPLMVEILADILQRPTFPTEHIERVRNQRLVRLQEREQSTRSVSYRRFSEMIYGDHPYGPPTSGYIETVQEINRDHVARFHQDHYRPNQAIVVVSGDVEPEEVVALLESQFGDWPAAVEPPPPAHTIPPVTGVNGIQRKTFPMPGKVQSDVVVGCLAIPRKHPDYHAVQVANNILGQFGMMGRLGENVRERQGLAYYSYSALDADIGIGPWVAFAGVNPQNVDQAIDSILHEFERLGQEPVSDEELSDSIANMTGTLPLRLETNDGVASILLNIEWFGLGLDYLQTYQDRIKAITAEDVQRVAAQYLRTDAYTLVTAGPDPNEN